MKIVSRDHPSPPAPSAREGKSLLTSLIILPSVAEQDVATQDYRIEEGELTEERGAWTSQDMSVCRMM